MSPGDRTALLELVNQLQARNPVPGDPVPGATVEPHTVEVLTASPPAAEGVAPEIAALAEHKPLEPAAIVREFLSDHASARYARALEPNAKPFPETLADEIRAMEPQQFLRRLAESSLTDNQQRKNKIAAMDIEELREFVAKHLNLAEAGVPLSELQQRVAGAALGFSGINDAQLLHALRQPAAFHETKVVEALESATVHQPPNANAVVHEPPPLPKPVAQIPASHHSPVALEPPASPLHATPVAHEPPALPKPVVPEVAHIVPQPNHRVPNLGLSIVPREAGAAEPAAASAESLGARFLGGLRLVSQEAGTWVRQMAQGIGAGAQRLWQGVTAGGRAAESPTQVRWSNSAAARELWQDARLMPTLGVAGVAGVAVLVGIASLRHPANHPGNTQRSAVTPQPFGLQEIASEGRIAPDQGQAIAP